ncbi:hypothetical protein [Lactiplantibacillus fabifermentans]|uniref:Extracellular protein n=2 Tax=Lactiplantibacillus fabifermentans TaxID=483011 RepID=A0A0R2NU55_9LACO|nr:hypothetical protein [Lactiplantibacillus fabifermentans]ETY74619.1 membrane protein [Lactiplantibacillus fabifermentans T30PCM01]KRO29224.1 hypothetical protein DY78_GL001275 [Lactiplantibacillus fabifermentans DSM 21115]
MKQFWSLALMILAGALLIFGSEYTLQGDHRQDRHQVVAKLDYQATSRSATITGHTKHGVIVTFRSGKTVRQVISNKSDGRFRVQMPIKGQKRVVVQVVGLKSEVLKVPVASKG